MSRQRWIREKAEAPGLESESVTEALALALQLQSDASGRLSEEQVIEMGRELGIEPHPVHTTLRRWLEEPVTRSGWTRERY